MAADRYVVTGINRLTGERGICSRPYSLERCRQVRDAMAKANHRTSVWTHLKIESAVREVELFSPPHKINPETCNNCKSVC